MSAPLKGVNVYVDVRSSDGKANYSSCVSNQLKLLGAEIQPILSSLCSHVVFKDGKVNTRIQSNKLGLKLVNVLWVEKCRETDSKCDETNFPVTDDQVDTPLHLRKTRTRYRSLQPASCIANKERVSRARKKKTDKRNSEKTEPEPAVKVTALKKDARLKKLQWPPDHSDVCSEAELVAHEEIGQDMKKAIKRKGKRKLKKSGIFDQSITSTQNDPQEAASLTDNFVLSKASIYGHEQSSDTKEDSQFSSYDASQHFERTDYSVTNIINQLEATIERDPVDSFSDILNSDSEGDTWNSPTRSKRTCQLTNSQKNVMDKTFDFDEVDRVNSEKKPRKKPQKHRVCKDENVRTKIRSKVISPTKSTDCVHIDSPSKMITFNSNYADNSDIVTDIDHGSLEPDNEQIEALERIKSPTIMGPKKSKSSNSRRSVKSTTQKCSANNVRRELNKELDHVHSKKNQHKNLTLSDKSEIELEHVSSLPTCTSNNTLGKDQVLSSEVVQAPEITSTSDPKPRRISQRTRHSSYKLSDPNFVLSQSAGGQCRNKYRDSSSSVADAETVFPEPDPPIYHGISRKSKKNVDDNISSSNFMSSESFASVDGKKDIRKSNRKRRANSKYSLDASSTHRPSSCDSSLAEQPSDKENNPTSDLPGDRNSVTESVDISSSLQTSDKKASRKSGRVRKSNPKYQSDSVNPMISKAVLDTDLLKTDGTYFKNPLSSTHEDLSASEYSTTETPVIKKTLTKREKKPATIVTTTDTEESASERLDVRPSSKRKKAKKCDSSDRVDLVKKRRSQNNAAPAAADMKVICTTCCHRDDQAMVRKTAKLFSATISESVVKDTTHVVMGTSKRTINLLKAVIHGAYVLSLQWVTDSISKDSWQKESKYQFTSDFPILKMKGDSRKRAASLLFVDLGLIFVEKDTSPPQQDLTDLITLCGGKVTRSRTRSRYCIGGAAQDKDHISLSEQWVLDSITQLRVQETSKYLLFPYRSPSPEF